MGNSRKFVSIQTAVEESSVALIAIADDGTAWTIAGSVGNNWKPYSGSEWVQIPSLPSKEATPIPPIAL